MSTELPQIREAYDRLGYVFPLPVLTAEETAFYRGKMVEYLERIDYKLDVLTRHKPHLFLKWANDLGRHPKILEPVRGILGEDILLWYSVVFVKPGPSEGYVAWHQDSHYWAMSEEKGLTAWLALSDVTVENGCMQMVGGSHRQEQDWKHEVVAGDRDNILHRGQKIVGLNPDQFVNVELKAGEMSIHELRTLHGSGPNRTPQPRLGIAFRYIPTTNYPSTLKFMKRSAALVSGKYDFRHFREDAVPSFDYDPVGLKARARSMRVAAVHTLFGDKSRNGLRKVIDSLPIILSRGMGAARTHLGRARD